MSKRILITGGAGFIGHHLIQEILERTDWEIVTLDRLDVSGNLNRIAEVLAENQQAILADACCGKEQTETPWARRIKVVWHDLKAPINEQIAHAIGDINFVIHMAAGSHVDRSIDYPMEFVMDNVVGTANLLDHFKGAFYSRVVKNLEFFLYFSTDEVFGPAPEGVHYKEWDRYHSGNPYAATKAGAEELCLAYQNTYKMPISITHTMNVIGIRQHPEKFVPKVTRKVRDGELVTIHANKDCTKAGSRHYIDARDVADAVLFLINKSADLEPGDKYNIVGEREMDNLELAQTIAKGVGKELKYELVDFHSARPGHDLRYALDGSKMKAMGWEPKAPINVRLGEIVEWSLANEDRWLFTPKAEQK